MRFATCIACVLMTISLSGQLGAQATTCACPTIPAKATATGECSRHETATSCSLVFSDATADQYSPIHERLSRFELPTNIDSTLRLAALVPPDEWPADFAFVHLPILVALSFPDDEVESFLLLRSVLSEHTDLIGSAIANRELRTRAELRELGDFRTALSFGCFEIATSRFSSVVKTRWSSATVGCRFVDF